MKRYLPGLILLSLLGFVGCQEAPAQENIRQDRVPSSQEPMEVHFSPKRGCTKAVVREIGKAKSSILVQDYCFTSAQIAKALLDTRNF
jgi:hypothetical protein